MTSFLSSSDWMLHMKADHCTMQMSSARRLHIMAPNGDVISNRVDILK